ncbi:hypothetical protein ZEAMMB73_Zm00001d025478 [Zea mays]|uniref:Uncharacterized protein n=1 Tax=Zea mays TaxID=4577 RepID=A0A1D6J7D3_MAIZE|nr:hypothetical protein ZEAMMB73_Zm00001d025478 [Zea mays]
MSWPTSPPSARAGAGGQPGAAAGDERTAVQPAVAVQPVALGGSRASSQALTALGSAGSQALAALGGSRAGSQALAAAGGSRAGGQPGVPAVGARPGFQPAAGQRAAGSGRAASTKKARDDDQEIPGVGKFKNRPLQNEDDMKVMFGSIINEETDHWNPMSSNPIMPPSPDQSPHIDLENGEDNVEENGEENGGQDIGDDIFEVSPTPSNKPKTKATIILDKPKKKSKTSTGLVIQEHISKISKSADAFICSDDDGDEIEDCFRMVLGGAMLAQIYVDMMFV